MLLVGGLVFPLDSLFKKGNYLRKNDNGWTPDKVLTWIVFIILALPTGAENVIPFQLEPCLSVCLCNPGPSTVPGTWQAFNKCLLSGKKYFSSTPTMDTIWDH